MRSQSLSTLLLLFAVGSSGCTNQSMPNARVAAGLNANQVFQIQPKAKPKTSSDALMYVAGIPTSQVLAYPSGKLVGTIDQEANAPCVDSTGDVFMPGSNALSEYHHGATTPFAEVSLGDNLGLACAVDPTTNDVAVILVGSVKGTEVAVFPSRSSSPTYYSTEYTPLYCGYDTSGNLFVDGSASSGSLWIAELKSGATSFSSLSVNRIIEGAPLQMQWDGNQMTAQASTIIYRLSIGGSTATIIGKTTIKGTARDLAASFIYRDRVIEPSFLARRHQFFSNIGIWNYPKGGEPITIVRRLGKHTRFTGVALSLSQ
jgi:hypothetical protein